MELQHLKNIAAKLNFSYHPNIGVEKLEQKLKAYCKNNNISFEEISNLNTEKEVNMATEKKETKMDLSKLTFADLEKEHNKEASDERTRDAMKLIRCIITCNNKNKTNYQGEIFSARNAIIPEVKKFIPFGVTTHVPQILFNMIKEKEYQTFKEERLPNGNKTMRSHMIPEYNIQVLDPITPAELEAIKQKQLAEGFTGE